MHLSLRVINEYNSPKLKQREIYLLEMQYFWKLCTKL
jgi:hypothetical protein